MTPSSPSPTVRPPHHKLKQIVDAHLKPTGYIRVAAHRFLSFLQTEFPQVSQLSELCRDPHLLGFLRCLCQQDPPLCQSTRHIYLVGLRSLLRDLASQGHPLQPGLILPEDIPRRPQLQHDLRRTIFPRSRRPHIFEAVFDTQIQTLATILRPHTVCHYRTAVRHFLSYLQTDFPQVSRLSELRRDSHVLGFLRYLCQTHSPSPLSNSTRLQYLVDLRRLLQDLASQGHSLQPQLILTEDFPRLPQHLPRALSPEEDQLLQQELRRVNDLSSNALLLTRATGIRIGECIHLALDCLRPLGQDQWAIHVPLGKLYTERLVPVDAAVRQLVTRILELRALTPPSHSPQSAEWLLPRSQNADGVYRTLSDALARAAKRAGCFHRITCHQLRHTYATEMLRLGVSLPALMHLLGHKHINMTLRYLQLTQQDLQREFHLALQNMAQRHLVPQLALPDASSSPSCDPQGIRRVVEASRRLLEMYRRQLNNEKSRRVLQRLEKRLRAVLDQLDNFSAAEK
jgi:site-specific recombinase XerD